jgi:hypothetical protein
MIVFSSQEALRTADETNAPVGNDYKRLVDQFVRTLLTRDGVNALRTVDALICPEQALHTFAAPLGRPVLLALLDMCTCEQRQMVAKYLLRAIANAAGAWAKMANAHSWLMCRLIDAATPDVREQQIITAFDTSLVTALADDVNGGVHVLRKLFTTTTPAGRDRLCALLEPAIAELCTVRHARALTDAVLLWQNTRTL